MSTAEPPRVGRYELLAVLGTGGMGRVLLARELPGGRLRAVKVPHAHFATDPGVIAMLLDEGHIASRIRHPNVVCVREAHPHPTFGAYLAMDYVEGFALREMLPRFAEPTRDVWALSGRILLDALAGLGASHGALDERGTPLELVHRDVTPHNVLVGVDGVARLSDFGVARAQQRVTITRTGQLKGKTGYMAPEHARAEPVDARADLFSVGVMLWECLTLQRFARGRSDAERVIYMESGRYPRAKSLVASVPPELDAVAFRAVQADPYLRYQTADSMAEALRDALSRASLETTHERVSQFIRGRFAAELDERRREMIEFLGHAPPPWDEQETDIFMPLTMNTPHDPHAPKPPAPASSDDALLEHEPETAHDEEEHERTQVDLKLPLFHELAEDDDTKP